MVIIDDYKDYLVLLSEYLSIDNKYTFICLEGITDITELSILNPSIVLLDLHMPTLSGDQILKLMRGIPKLANIPVILITALKQQASHETLDSS